MSSILNDVKTLLGIQNEYNAFDNDLILHINSAFAILYQLGVGPTDSAFKINSDAETWESFSDITNVEDVKEYVTLKVKIVWDSALPNSVIEVIKGRIDELEWRLRLECDKTGTPSPEPGPGPTPTTDTYSKTEIDKKDEATLTMAKAYTDVMTYSKAEVDIKDTETLSSSKDYTDTKLTDYYSKTEVDNKDTATLDSAKGYTDTKIGDYYTKTETNNLLADKQDTLTAGTNITIDANNVISATGGGGGTVDTAMSDSSTNAVQNRVIKSYIDNGLKPLDYKSYAINENVKSINHRGYNTVAPENTLPAYLLSKKMGFGYVECDVEITSDGVLVLLHDMTINRTARNADGTQIAETISIRDITYEQALTYDFGIWKSNDYAGTKIPTLEQFLKLCKNLGLHPYLDLKSIGQTNIENIVATVNKCGMRGNVTYLGGAYELLYVKNVDDNARLGLVAQAPTGAPITGVKNLRTGNNYVFIDTQGASAEQIANCIAENIPLEIWTVNSEQNILNLDSYYSGVTSDSLIAGEVLFNANIN